MTSHAKGLLVLACLGLSPRALAELPLETLALIDTASVQDQLELQATVFPAYLGWRSPRHDAFSAALELELGVIDGVQVMAGLPIEHHRTDAGNATGLGNAELGASVALVNTHVVVLSAGSELEFPASDALIGDEAFGVSPFALGDVALGPLHAALAAGLDVELDAGTEFSPTLGAGLYLELGPFLPTLEFVAVFAEELEAMVAPGLFVNLSEAWEVGAAGIVGLSSAAPDHGFIVAITFETELADDETKENDP